MIKLLNILEIKNTTPQKIKIKRDEYQANRNFNIFEKGSGLINGLPVRIVSPTYYSIGVIGTTFLMEEIKKFLQKRGIPFEEKDKGEYLIDLIIPQKYFEIIND